PHPLLAQIPLTISPFLSLPTATPLPYTYKTLPSTLPPSILSTPATSDPSTSTSTQQQPASTSSAYVTSLSGETSSTPDAILSSCLALQSHLTSLETSARSTLQAWEEARRAADLAEKRRVAPGWLDEEVKLLVPENATGEGRRPQPERRTSVGIKGLMERRDGVPDPQQGEELDRVFGGLDLK
ncbi:hypothetical protein BCR34DRAFT_496888, partial [Clohesyomyces aquaticus]